MSMLSRCASVPRLALLLGASVVLGGLASAVSEGAETESSCCNALDGRGKEKARWLVEGGGNEASERAVAMALNWLADHQLADGGWSFDHRQAPGCQGKCRNPGELPEARNAATAVALLPFLAAGQTHKTGKYKEEVLRGLYYLVNQMKVSPHGGSLHEGDGKMYSHAIATIALCEAYAMTHDRGLYPPAQQAVNFVSYAQDPDGGGWGCEPRQEGDTSGTGWALTALKTGHMAYLRVPPLSIRKAGEFLDSVQADGGAQYGSTEPADGNPGTTATGLLMRMYLGWKQDNLALKRGVGRLHLLGPSRTNLYYNYYATQVMRHSGGDAWQSWNAVMRDHLVRSQARTGHEAGSWCFQGERDADVDALQGGRLCATALATMILEVYYRHLPIYRKLPGHPE